MKLLFTAPKEGIFYRNSMTARVFKKEMSDDPHSPDDFRDPHAEANDPLWRLLGRAPMAEPDGWFRARTLARCRLSAAERSPGWLSKWRWALGTGLGACLAVAAAVHVHQESVMHQRQQNVQDAFAIVASVNDENDVASAGNPPEESDSSY